MDSADTTPVAKRPRLSGPDGFTKSKQRPKPALSNIPAPVFKSPFSAIQTPSKPASSGGKVSKGKERAPPAHEKPNSAPAPAHKRMSAPPRPLHDTPPPADAPANVASSSKAKPPSRSNPSNPFSHLAPTKSASTPARLFSDRAPASKPLSVLPQYVARAPVPPSTPPQRRAPPTFPAPPGTPSKPLKPISTTRVARATDLRSEGGGAEVLALHLQQQGAPRVSAGERAVAGGLDFTPQKPGHARAQRYLRGGLAERVHGVLGRAQMARTLWRKETAAAARAPAPDTVLCVGEAIHAPGADARAHTGLWLARCRGEDGQDVLVLLSSAPGGDGDARIATLESGRSIGVWRPFMNIDFTEELVPEGGREWPRQALLCTRFSVMK
ncbi:hypothetical protein FA95DRAFT_1677347 [Auriscalpium vulgare]|uniref:Uncharacterized protein n=1 Tax=Auriscalpium vulgare TaxID=40419 RepID=A0ACB8S1N5_9AGAM|nr:hypothetical protein FA95DRAFT_1677347 [Auriscalpium vulgare]